MNKKVADISRLCYSPAGRKLDVEILLFSDIIQRSTPSQVRATHRYDFHLILLVTDGTPIQIVDFEPVQCRPGSVLVIRPGQVHSFGPDPSWQGWLLLLCSDFLPVGSDISSDLVPGRILEILPRHMALGYKESLAIREDMATMAYDARNYTPDNVVHQLLRYKLSSLILRLSIFNGQTLADEVHHSLTLKRFDKFRSLLEAEFSNWHQVGYYAKMLSCTQKSLNQATRDVAGIGAKAFIARRIILEAKRLLAHTSRPIYLIAYSLGFDEATNFAKFFRRNVGQSPMEFRTNHR